MANSMSVQRNQLREQARQARAQEAVEWQQARQEPTPQNLFGAPIKVKRKEKDPLCEQIRDVLGSYDAIAPLVGQHHHLIGVSSQPATPVVTGPAKGGGNLFPPPKNNVPNTNTLSKAPAPRQNGSMKPVKPPKHEEECPGVFDKFSALAPKGTEVPAIVDSKDRKDQSSSKSSVGDPVPVGSHMEVVQVELQSKSQKTTHNAHHRIRSSHDSKPPKSRHSSSGSHKRHHVSSKSGHDSHHRESASLVSHPEPQQKPHKPEPSHSESKPHSRVSPEKGGERQRQDSSSSSSVSSLSTLSSQENPLSPLSRPSLHQIVSSPQDAKPKVAENSQMPPPLPNGVKARGQGLKLQMPGEGNGQPTSGLSGMDGFSIEKIIQEMSLHPPLTGIQTPKKQEGKFPFSAKNEVAQVLFSPQKAKPDNVAVRENQEAATSPTEPKMSPEETVLQDLEVSSDSDNEHQDDAPQKGKMLAGKGKKKKVPTATLR